MKRNIKKTAVVRSMPKPVSSELAVLEEILQTAGLEPLTEKEAL